MSFPCLVNEVFILLKCVNVFFLQNKIKNNKYRCLEDLEDDFMLMCKNAQTYNVEGSEIFEHSIVLGSIFTDIKEKFEREFEQRIAAGQTGGGGGQAGGSYDGDNHLSDSDFGTVNLKFHEKAIGSWK